MTSFNNVDGETAIKKWLTEGIDQTAIAYAEKFGEYLANNKLSTSQIRNVFGEVKRIQMKGRDNFADVDVLLLKPKLAYARARRAGIGNEAAQSAESLQKVLSSGIDQIFTGDVSKKYDRFENFANFFEAVLAYHKANGGK